MGQLLTIFVNLINAAILLCVFIIFDWIGQHTIGRYFTFDEIEWILQTPVIIFLIWVYCFRDKDWWKPKKYRSDYNCERNTGQLYKSIK